MSVVVILPRLEVNAHLKGNISGLIRTYFILKTFYFENMVLHVNISFNLDLLSLIAFPILIVLCKQYFLVRIIG